MSRNRKSTTYAVCYKSQQEENEILQTIKLHNNPTNSQVYLKEVGEPLTDLMKGKVTGDFHQDSQPLSVIVFSNKYGRCSTFSYFFSKGLNLMVKEECIAFNEGNTVELISIDQTLG
jgi:hypothetical protein